MAETAKYWGVLFMALAAFLVPTSLIFLSHIFSKIRIRPKPDSEKNVSRGAPYESGMTPVGTARVKFNFRFYLFALLFLIFDVEVLFIFPWAARFLHLGFEAYVAMLPFLMLVLIGFLYEWKKEALEWK
jgi:NADH-quinone oxidoreductase subunit A